MSITFASAFSALLQLASAPLRSRRTDDGCWRPPFANTDALSAHERRDVGLEPADIARQSWQLY